MTWIASLYLFMLIFRPFEYWPALQDLYIERITLIILVMATAMTRHKKWHAAPLNGAVVALLLAFGLCTATSDNPALSFDPYYELVKFTLLYFVFQMILVNARDIVNLVLGYLAVMGIYVGKSAWEFFVNGRIHYRMGIARMMGVDITLGDPNSFAGSIVYSLPLAVMALRIPGLPRYVRRLIIGYCVLDLVALMFTGSRSGELTCLLFGAMLWTVSSRKALYLSLAILALGTLWFFTPEDYQQRFESTFNHDIGPANAAESADSRLILFEQALGIFSHHPLTGVGPGMFQRHVESQLEPHNLYGEILSEEGLIGAFAFLMFLAVLAQELSRCVKIGRIPVSGTAATASPIPGLVGTAGRQTIILLLFNGCASHNFFRYNWLFVAALAVAAGRLEQRLPPQSGGQSHTSRGKPCRQSA